MISNSFTSLKRDLAHDFQIQPQSAVKNCTAPGYWLCKRLKEGQKNVSSGQQRDWMCHLCLFHNPGEGYVPHKSVQDILCAKKCCKATPRVLTVCSTGLKPLPTPWVCVRLMATPLFIYSFYQIFLPKSSFTYETNSFLYQCFNPNTYCLTWVFSSLM